MKIFRLRSKKRLLPPGYRPPPSTQDKPAVSRTDADRPNYEKMRVKSAILAHLENLQPEGATLHELVLALGFERALIQTVVNTLTHLEIVSVTATGKVVLGPPPKLGASAN